MESEDTDALKDTEALVFVYCHLFVTVLNHHELMPRQQMNRQT